MTTTPDTEKLAQPSSGTVPVAWPPPHDRYLVERNGHACVATPCYGMHSPWWVVETLTGQLDPRPIESGDQWHAIAAHESRAQPASEPPNQYKLVGWVHPIYLDGQHLAMEVSTVHLAEAQIPVFICIGNAAQPASVTDGFKTALEQIKALPLRPFPDPVGHSWEAFGRAVMGAFTDARMTAVHALDAAPQPPAKKAHKQVAMSGVTGGGVELVEIDAPQPAKGDEE